MPPPSLVAALRAATASRHEALDRTLALSADSVTPARYVSLLRGSLAVVDRLEPALVAWFGDAARGDRVARLRSDLARMHADDDATSIDLRLPENAAEAHGCAYVVEGSALGGRVLAPIVERALGFAPGEATRYLRLRGDATGSHWRAWVARIDAFGRDASDAERTSACRFACHTFDSFALALRAVREAQPA